MLFGPGVKNVLLLEDLPETRAWLKALVLQVLFATAAHAQALPTYFPVVRGAHPHDVAGGRSRP